MFGFLKPKEVTVEVVREVVRETRTEVTAARLTLYLAGGHYLSALEKECKSWWYKHFFSPVAAFDASDGKAKVEAVEAVRLTDGYYRLGGKLAMYTDTPPKPEKPKTKGKKAVR